jgi:S-formylglutathione hydrolase FrmB
MNVTRRTTAAALSAVVGVVGLVVGPGRLAGAATLPTLPNPDSHGIDLDGNLTAVAGSRADSWLLDAKMTSTAVFVRGPSGATPAISPLAQQLHVRILLPDNYNEADTTRRYPVLYLLHGGSGSAPDWTDSGDIRGLVNAVPAFPGIVVMPEGGRAGWYADWYGETDGHARPLWETFHVGQLVPWIDANFNTVADRSGRAVAGLSMGGLGSVRYAARHADVFSAVASLSGAVDTRYEPMQDTVSNSMWFYGATVVDQGQWQSEYRVTTGQPAEDEETSRLVTLFGPTTAPVAPETRPGWPAMNPVELAAAGRLNAYGTRLALYSGDSLSANDGGEEDIVTMTNALHAALNGQHVTHRYCRGFGKHEWAYWKNDLRDFLQYVYGTAPATCTTNGRDTTTTTDDWSLVP